jgi:diguanylate cyclase (GGDEF)-like protein
MSLDGWEDSGIEQVQRRGVPFLNQGLDRRSLSRDHRKYVPKKTFESMLSSALRSEDKQLDDILHALEEISIGLKSAGPDFENLSDALRRAAWGAFQQALLDRELCYLSITDDLTGLLNRRGFLASATHQLKVAQRNGQSLMLFFCDIDNLKRINDSCGHREGDLALIRAAGALEQTFRESDLLARLGGDEFAALATEAGQNHEVILSRLEENLRKSDESYANLSLSVGLARFDPKCPTSLGELMSRADQAMYEYKIGHQKI